LVLEAQENKNCSLIIGFIDFLLLLRPFLYYIKTMEELRELKKRYKTLPEDPSQEVIENTARRLEGMKFTPTLLINIKGFNFLGKDEILAEFSRVSSLSEEDLVKEGMTLPAEPDIFRLNHLKLLFYFYELLTRLRKDDPLAWDEINELYEDD
jgi:hypothetical protein